MTELDTLLSTYCPKATPTQPLSQLGTFFDGLQGKSQKDFTHGNAQYVPYFNVAQNRLVNMEALGQVVVTEDEKPTPLAYKDVLFTASSDNREDCGLVSVLDSEPTSALYLNSYCKGFRLHNPGAFDAHYLAHVFQCKALRKAMSRAAQGKTQFILKEDALASLAIAHPPLEVQTQIGAFLDSLCEEKAKLEAELALRAEQLKTYRRILLQYKEGKRHPFVGRMLASARTWTQFLTIGEVFDVQVGFTPSAKNVRYWRNGTIPWVRLDDILERGPILSDTRDHVTPEATKLRLFPANSLLISTSATVGVHALVTVPHIANQRFVSMFPNSAYQRDLMPEYVYHCGSLIGEWCQEHLLRGNFARIDTKTLRTCQFAVPPMEVQEQVCAFLSALDTLVNDRRTGLPRAIALREARYAYYREALIGASLPDEIE